MEIDEEQDKEVTLETPGVIDKYQAAGKVVNSVLVQVMSKCKDGADVHELCSFGESLVHEELKKVFKKKKDMTKGIAFPLCISVNEVCGHFSPLKDESEQLKNGDVVKLDLGVHIDGFVAMAAHTMVIQSPVVQGEGEESKEAEAPKVSGRKADAVLAAYKALQAAFRTLRPGVKNSEVTQKIAEVCADYNVNLVEGVLSHELKQNLIDDNFCIINKHVVGEQEVEEKEFQVNQVFGVDVFVSTGEGQPKQSDKRMTVYKRSLENTYILKSKHARAFFKNVTTNYPTLAFSIGQFKDPIQAKMGVAESMKHELLDGYPVLVEKNGDVVAQFKFTVMILKKQTCVVAGLNMDESLFSSDNKISNEETENLLKLDMSAKSQKNRQKKLQKAKKLEAEKQSKEQTEKQSKE